MELHMVVRTCFNGVHAIEYVDGKPAVYVEPADAELLALQLRASRPGEKYRVVAFKAR